MLNTKVPRHAKNELTTTVPRNARNTIPKHAKNKIPRHAKHKSL